VGRFSCRTTPDPSRPTNGGALWCSLPV
jgi:hypothetical protein